MRIKHLLGILSLSLISFSLFTQNSDRELTTKRIENPPKIDGYLDDEAWESAPIAKDFVQFEPYNGKNPTQKTDVKMVYSNSAIYIGAMLYDEFPDSISKNLCKRDEGFDASADLFVCIFNPFNDGINSFEFTVTASGVQNDLRHAGTDGDMSWDAVWKSEVIITDKGWQVEMEIPYSALRFPKTKEQT